MNIFIYGNSSFKEEIHKTLEHANIKFKLDIDSKIEDINDLDILKEKITQNPKDIYLIDDSKIIKKSLLNEKISFLKPKDGIEQEFLLENGIADTELESLEDIPKYIIQKHDEIKKDNIEESIIDIVDEAYGNEEIELDEELTSLLVKDDNSTKVDFTEDVGLNNINSDYDNGDSILVNEDEELSLVEDKQDFDLMEELGSLEEIEKESELDDPLAALEEFDFSNSSIDNTTENSELEPSVNEDDLDSLMEELSLSEDNIKDKNKNFESLERGVENMDEFSQLDSLNEKDILDALQGVNTTPVATSKPVVKNNNSQISSSEKVEVSSANVDELSQLITKLLNNKTLEITIKVKD